ncbi:DUF1127 domain-containing protein [Pseudosulfitobacter sp. SM2401]|uniref:DUF1127 domain-containing protein n=1 Tax=Pseudosulfitobacter sp. SM2401 TaxID=3350098 RepID=UPI0036F1F750
MAITRSNNWLDVVLEAGRTFFHQKRKGMQRALARRKVYRATYSELAALSDRDLNDLGIRRSNIKRMAMEAAYDF